MEQGATARKLRVFRHVRTSWGCMGSGNALATKPVEQPLAATKGTRGEIRSPQDRRSHETHERHELGEARVQAYSTGLPFVEFVRFVAKNGSSATCVLSGAAWTMGMLWPL